MRPHPLPLLALLLALSDCRVIVQRECDDRDLEPLPLPTTGRLNAVAVITAIGDGINYGVAIAGDDGLLAISTAPSLPFTVDQPVTVDLHAVTGGPERLVFAVGAAGTVLGTHLDPVAWQSFPAGTTADLWGVAWLQAHPAAPVLAVGDEVVLRRDPGAGQWLPLTPPGPGWGRLRAVFSDDRRIYVAGLGGAMWSTTDLDTWAPEEPGTDADLLAGTFTPFDRHLIVVGADGTALQRIDAWTPLPGEFTGTLIAASPGYLLAADGSLYSLSDFDHAYGEDPPPPVVRLPWSLPGARALTNEGDYTDLLLVGDAGLAERLGSFCEED